VAYPKNVQRQYLTCPSEFQNHGQLRLRLVARPDKPVAQLLASLGLALPTSPKIIQNVMEKIA
jgi:hypothetical protein